MENIFHIVAAEVWSDSNAEANYSSPSLDVEGFIHCSTASQVIKTANRVFKGCDGLVVLIINPNKLVSKLVYEDTSGSGEDFPHIYGPLNRSAVEGVQPLRVGPDGFFEALSEIWLDASLMDLR